MTEARGNDSCVSDSVHVLAKKETCSRLKQSCAAFWKLKSIEWLNFRKKALIFMYSLSAYVDIFHPQCISSPSSCLSLCLASEQEVFLLKSVRSHHWWQNPLTENCPQIHEIVGLTCSIPLNTRFVSLCGHPNSVFCTMSFSFVQIIFFCWYVPNAS